MKSKILLLLLFSLSACQFANPFKDVSIEIENIAFDSSRNVEDEVFLLHKRECKDKYVFIFVQQKIKNNSNQDIFMDTDYEENRIKKNKESLQIEYGYFTKKSYNNISYLAFIQPSITKIKKNSEYEIRIESIICMDKLNSYKQLMTQFMFYIKPPREHLRCDDYFKYKEKYGTIISSEVFPLDHIGVENR